MLPQPSTSTFLPQTTKPNITAQCNIPPPDSSACAKIPICGPYDYNKTASICRPELSTSSCLAGFIYVHFENNVFQKPPKNVISLSQLPAGSTNTDAPCYQKDWPYTRACCPGFYCPANQYCMIPCDKSGSYCPSSDTIRFPNCSQLFNVVNTTIETESYPELMGCGGSIVIDTLCPDSHYCSNSTEKIECPKGSYCRAGSNTHQSCSGFMSCPIGSSAPGLNIGILIVAIIIICIIAAFIAIMKFKKYPLKVYLCCGVADAESKSQIIRSSEKRKLENLENDVNINNSLLSYNYLSTLFANRSMTVSQKRNQKHYSVNQVHDDEKEVIDSRTKSRDKSGEHSMKKHRFQTVSSNSFIPTHKQILEQKQNHDRIAAKNSMDIKAKDLDFVVDIEFKNLSLTLRSNGKKVLDRCSGHFRCGTVNAIMGPSGAGKTTLLNTLSGKALAYGNMSGQLLINGEKKTVNDFKDIVGFVPQSDAMTPEMTVQEMLEFNAKFRLSSKVSIDYRKSVVRDVMKVLKIYHIRHSCIGDDETRGISGGQQKRVNIGMELVAQPSILFLDEPTSGLDATTANDVMEVLKLIAKRGTMVVVVLHQPRYEIFSQFDNLLLLAQGGKTVYNGQQSKAMIYFKEMGYIKPEFVNPADFLLDIISGIVENTKNRSNEVIDFAGTWRDIDKTKYSIMVNKEFVFDKDNNNYSSRSKLSFVTQCSMCCMRQLTINLRQKWLILTDILLIMLCGFVVGFVVDSSNLQLVPSNIDFTIMGASVIGTIVSLRIFGNDRLMYWRFASAGINKFAYYLGSTIASTPWIFLEPFFLLLTWYPMAMPHAKYIDYYSWLTIGMFVVQGIGHAISVAVDSNKSVLTSVVIVMIFNFLNGFQPTLISLHQTVFGKLGTSLCYSRWQQEALFGKEMGSWNEVYANERNFQHSYYGWKSDSQTYVIDFFMMLMIGFGFRVIGYLLLIFLNRARQL
eukprot:110765_1